MELRNLITFLKIIETGSFSKAAEQLLYSQSTVTIQIQQLEEELGVPLFERVGRRMVLTEAGERAQKGFCYGKRARSRGICPPDGPPFRKDFTCRRRHRRIAGGAYHRFLRFSFLWRSAKYFV